jgi:hypothetical protein
MMPNPTPRQVELREPDAGEFEVTTSERALVSKENDLENERPTCLPCDVIMPMVLPTPETNLPEIEESDVHFTEEQEEVHDILI